MVSKEEFREYCKSLIPKEELEKFDRRNKARAKFTKNALIWGSIIAIAIVLIVFIITQSLISAVIAVSVAIGSVSPILIIVLVLINAGGGHIVLGAAAAVVTGGVKTEACPRCRRKRCVRLIFKPNTIRAVLLRQPQIIGVDIRHIILCDQTIHAAVFRENDGVLRIVVSQGNASVCVPN